jgi:hypothetical protein
MPNLNLFEMTTQYLLRLQCIVFTQVQRQNGAPRDWRWGVGGDTVTETCTGDASIDACLDDTREFIGTFCHSLHRHV